MRKMKSDHGEVVEEVIVGDDQEEEEELVLPGFRFHPTDEELVTFYLRRKVAGKRLSIEIIKEMDIYKHDPWDLSKVSTVGCEKEWYFFCLRGRKYRNSIRPNRVTGSGFWKATGIDRPIYSAGDCIGLKKSLVYYRGSAGKGTKTDWMMHEFRLPLHPGNTVDSSPPSLQEAEVWTICRIFKRNITDKKQPQQVAGKVAVAAVAAVAQPDSSSITGSLESDSTGNEYMNSVPQAPVNNGYNQQFQGQWNSVPPQPFPAMAAFHQSVLSPPVPNDLYKDGCWDDIGRMVMELTDPSVFYDCRYA